MRGADREFRDRLGRFGGVEAESCGLACPWQVGAIESTVSS